MAEFGVKGCGRFGRDRFVLSGGHGSLLLYCLLEREARRALARTGEQKVRRLLAGHVDAVPTGENILLAFEHLFLFIEEEEHGRTYHLSELFPEQETLWRLLDIRVPVWF